MGGVRSSGARWRTIGLIAGYVIAAGVCSVLAARGAARFCDLYVYRLGGRDVLSGTPLSQVNYAGYMPFTYPPVAALLFTVFAALPWTATTTLMTAASAVALPAALYFALRLPPVSSWLARGDAARLALTAATAALWLEPVRATLAYGQIDVLLALLICYDISRPDGARFKGAGIGLAAGIKLTPGIFAVYLLLTRRYRAAAVAAVTFGATVAAGYAVIPSSAAWYWQGTFLDPGRVGNGHLQVMTMNQSLLGMLARLLHRGTVPAGWLVLVGLTGVAGLALATWHGRAGNEAAGFSLCAVTGLLICPVSWTHHWVLAVPGLLLAAVMIWHRGWHSRRATLAWLLVLAGVAVIGWTGLVRRISAPGGPLHLSPAGIVAGDSYVLAGLVALAVAAWPVIPWRRRSNPTPDPRSPAAGRRPAASTRSSQPRDQPVPVR